MSLQGALTALIVLAAALYLAVQLAPLAWRGAAAARLGRIARRPESRPWVRWIATRVGRALSLKVGCEGCSGRGH